DVTKLIAAEAGPRSAQVGLGWSGDRAAPPSPGQARPRRLIVRPVEINRSIRPGPRRLKPEDLVPADRTVQVIVTEWPVVEHGPVAARARKQSGWDVTVVGSPDRGHAETPP